MRNADCHKKILRDEIYINICTDGEVLSDFNEAPYLEALGSNDLSLDTLI